MPGLRFRFVLPLLLPLRRRLREGVTMPPAKKAAMAAATPAPEPDPVPVDEGDPALPPEGDVVPAPDPDEPDTEPAEGDEFCPDPGSCFPDGIPDHAVHVGCVHGHWSLSAE